MKFGEKGRAVLVLGLYIGNIILSAVILSVYMAGRFVMVPEASGNIAEMTGSADVLVISSVIQLILGFILAFVAVFLFRKELKAQFFEFFKKKYYLYMLLGVVVNMGLAQIAAIITGLIGGGVSANEQYIVDSLAYIPVLMGALAVIMAPLNEELVFRYSVSKLTGFTWWGFLLCSLPFALIHVTSVDVINVIPYVAMALVFTAFYFKTRNIWVSIGIHFINNLISILFSLAFMN